MSSTFGFDMEKMAGVIDRVGKEFTIEQFVDLAFELGAVTDAYKAAAARRMAHVDIRKMLKSGSFLDANGNILQYANVKIKVGNEVTQTYVQEPLPFPRQYESVLKSYAKRVDSAVAEMRRYIEMMEVTCGKRKARKLATRYKAYLQLNIKFGVESIEAIHDGGIV